MPLSCGQWSGFCDQNSILGASLSGSHKFCRLSSGLVSSNAAYNRSEKEDDLCQSDYHHRQRALNLSHYLWGFERLWMVRFRRFVGKARRHDHVDCWRGQRQPDRPSDALWHQGRSNTTSNHPRRGLRQAPTLRTHEQVQSGNHLSIYLWASGRSFYLCSSVWPACISVLFCAHKGSPGACRNTGWWMRRRRCLNFDTLASSVSWPCPRSVESEIWRLSARLLRSWTKG